MLDIDDDDGIDEELDEESGDEPDFFIPETPAASKSPLPPFSKGGNSGGEYVLNGVDYSMFVRPSTEAEKLSFAAEEDRRIESMPDPTRPLLNLFFEQARNMTPDQYAAALVASRSLRNDGMIAPESLLADGEVRQHISDEYEKKKIYNQLRGSDKQFIDWFMTPGNFQLARDDVETLNRIQQRTRTMLLNMAPTQDWTFGKIFRSMLANQAEGRYSVNKMNELKYGSTKAEEIYEVPEELREFMSLDEYRIYAATASESVRKSAKEWKDFWGEWRDYVSPGEYILPTSGFRRELHDAAVNAGFTIESGLKMTTAAITGGLLGGPIGATIAIAAMSPVLAHDEAKVEQAGVFNRLVESGVSIEEAYRKSSQEVYYPNIGLLTISNFIEGQLTLGIGKLFGAGTLSKGARYLRGGMLVAANMATNAGEEGGQEIFSSLALTGEIDCGDVGTAAWRGALASVLYSVPWGAIHAFNTRFQDNKIAALAAERAAIAKKNLDNTVTEVAASKLAARSPEKMGELVGNMTDGGVVYIDAATFEQRLGASARQAAEILGVSDQIETALESGADIEIDAAKYIVAAASDENIRALNGDVRMSIDPSESVSMNEAEIIEAQKEAAQRELAARKKVHDEAQIAIDETAKAAQAISDEFYNKLVATGRTDLFGKTFTGARAVADLLTARALVWGHEYNIAPQDIAAHFPIELGGDGSFEGRLAADEAKWGRTVDDVVNNGTQEKEIDVMTTPLVFTLLKTRDGKNIMALPLKMSGGKISQILKDHHGITADMLKQIPRALADPIAIFNSSGSSSNPNGLVAMLELKDNNGATIIAALHFNEKGYFEGIDVNNLMSAYGQARENNTPRDDWFLKQVTDGNLLYVDTQKSSLWAKQRGVQFPTPPALGSSLVNNIATEADLVKAREKYGNTLYQKKSQSADTEFANIERAYMDANGGKYYGFVPVSEIRKRIPEKERAALSDNLISLMRKNQLQLNVQGNPGALSAEDKDNPVMVGGTPRHNVFMEEPQYRQANNAEPAKGSVAFSEMGAIIRLFETADKSTILHELGHYFLEDMRRLANSPLLQEGRASTEFEAVKKWLDISDMDTSKSFDEMSGDEQKRWKNAQEKFAAGFEQYLFEGKAPSSELRRAFRTFKRWLAQIYKIIRGITYTDADGIRRTLDIDDNVRGMFDRMLSVESEAAISKNEDAVAALREEFIRQGMPDDQVAEYDKAAEADRDTAKAKLLKTMQKEMSNEERARVKAAREEAEAFARDELLQELPYETLDALTKLDGAFGFSEAEIDALIADKNANENTQIGGVSVGEVLDLFNDKFASVKDFIAALKEAREKPLNEEAKVLAEIATAADESMGNDAAALGEESERAAHSDASMRRIAAEISILKEKISEQKEGVKSVRATDELANIRAADEFARRTLENMGVLKAAAIKTYLFAERRASKNALSALTEGKYAEAIRFKQQELVAHALAKGAIDASREIRQATKFFANLLKNRKKMKYEMEGAWQQIAKMLQRFGFGAWNNVDLPSDMPSLVEWLREHDMTVLDKESREQLLLPDFVMDSAGKDSMKDLKFSEYRDVYDAARMIHAGAKKVNELLAGENARNFGEARIDLIQSIADNSEQKPEVAPEEQERKKKWFEALRKIPHELKRPETIARILDGLAAQGAATRELYLPIKEASDREIVMKEEAKDKIAEIYNKFAEAFGGVRALRSFLKKKIDIGIDFMRGDRRSFTGEQLLSIMLNWGTQNNRERVVFGERLDGESLAGRKPPAGMPDEQYRALYLQGEEFVNGMIEQYATREMWDFVENIWAFINSYWGDIKALEYKMTGVTPDKVEGISVKELSNNNINELAKNMP